MTDESDPTDDSSSNELVSEARTRGRPSLQPQLRRAINEMDQLDRDIYAAVAASPTPLLDEPMQRLSNAANFSKLWIGIAAALMLIGGKKGRRAGVTGLVAIAVASGVTNQGIKRMAHRNRPDRERESVVEARRVAMPTSTSFPSGHSASGFAFATAVGSQAPLAGVLLRFLAGAVAYSRVHTGVHYPGDVIIGSLIGSGIGSTVAKAADRYRLEGHRLRRTNAR